MDLFVLEGFFEVFIGKWKEVFVYELKGKFKNGDMCQFCDLYLFFFMFGDLDLYLFNEGNDYWVYEKFGVYIWVIDGMLGVFFVVWVFSVVWVLVVGNFNYWDGCYYFMWLFGVLGVWEFFIFGFGEGEFYKYEIYDQQKKIYLKIDLYGMYFEVLLNNVLVVYNFRKYVWNDVEWMEKCCVNVGVFD